MFQGDLGQSFPGLRGSEQIANAADPRTFVQFIAFGQTTEVFALYAAKQEPLAAAVEGQGILQTGRERPAVQQFSCAHVPELGRSPAGEGKALAVETERAGGIARLKARRHVKNME